jgi:replicative DNA helicase
MKNIEESIIGCLLLGGAEAMRKYAAGLEPGEFSDPVCKVIFTRMRDFQAAGKDFDLQIISAELRGEEGIDANYLTGLLANEFSPSKISEYTRQLKDWTFRTGMLNLLSKAKSEPVHEFVGELQRRIWEYQRGVRIDWTIGDALRRMLDEIEARRGGKIEYPTGFTDLDDMTGGFFPGEVTILAGRPSQGKSALAVNFCNNLLNAGKKVLYLDFETSDTKILNRLLSLRTEIPVSRMNRGKITEIEISEIVREAAVIEKLGFFVNDRSGTPIADVFTEVQNRRIDFIVVDYIQLMPGGGTEETNTTERLGNLTRSFKGLAKEMNIPVLLISQLNRANEFSGNKEPTLASLRGSGELEQNADNVMMLYWEHVYDMEKPEHENKLLVKKQRHGPVGPITLYWDPTIMKFANLRNIPNDSH